MKDTIQQTIADVKLKQFQDLYELTKVEGLTDKELEIHKLKIFIGLDDNQIKHISKKDYDSLIVDIDTALNKPSEFQNRFKMNGIEFGFIPNFDNISSLEYEHLMDFGEAPETLHNLMAILFRPITKKDKVGNYKIENYKASDKIPVVMLGMPLNIVNGALVFFLNTSKELKNYILKSLTTGELKKGNKLQSFSKSGDGMQVL